MNKLTNALLAATALTTGLGLVGEAHAALISTTFNFVPFGTLTANTGSILTATNITSGAPLFVSNIVTDNTGLVSGQGVSITSPTPVTVGATFTKSFTTSLGDFVENLTVDANNPVGTTLGVDATGTIKETVTLIGPTLTSSPVFYTASYTQNNGPGAEINASFNNSTTAPTPPPPPGVPEPASMALLGTALVGLGALRRRRRG